MECGTSSTQVYTNGQYQESIEDVFIQVVLIVLSMLCMFHVPSKTHVLPQLLTKLVHMLTIVLLCVCFVYVFIITVLYICMCVCMLFSIFMFLNTYYFIQRTEQVLIELDIIAIEEYVILLFLIKVDMSSLWHSIMIKCRDETK